jgi:hemin uptake protein HemP
MENTQPRSPAEPPQSGHGEAPRAAARRARPEESPPRLSSQDLFGAARRVIIEHDGREYLLLITRQGKLILNRGG